MPRKADPRVYSVFDPEGFRQAQTVVEEQTQGLRVLLRAQLSETEVIQYVFGPLPMDLEEVTVVFQVLWFGSEADAWPLDEAVPKPMVQTESPGLGRMVLWIFPDFTAGAELLRDLWGLVPEPLEMQ